MQRVKGKIEAMFSWFSYPLSLTSDPQTLMVNQLGDKQCQLINSNLLSISQFMLQDGHGKMKQSIDRE